MDRSEAAARRAFALASRLDASVALFSVVDTSVAQAAAALEDSARVRERLRESAETAVARLEAHARESGLPVEAAVREGVPAETIVDFAAESDADAIVMGTAGRGRVRRSVVGSIADTVVRTAPVPVVTYNPTALENGDGSNVDSIVIPTDGSRPAESAADLGIVLAARLDATAHLLAVADRQVARQLERVIDEEAVDSLDQLLKRAGAHLARLLTVAESRTVDTVTVTRAGSPAEVIVEYAEEHADLIVMGTRGRGGVDRFVLGSVADSVIREASVPIMSTRAADGLWESAGE